MKTIFKFLLPLCVVFNSMACCTTDGENQVKQLNDTMMKNESKYYQLVLIWVKDPVKFQEYGAKMGPAVAKYGGALDKMFAPSSIYAEGIEKPHMINLVHYENKEAFEGFENDPEFLAIKHLRTAGIDMISFEGYLEIDNASFDGLSDRLYNIEIGSYKDGNKDAYTKYEKEGESIMKEYGYQVEFKMAIDTPDKKHDFAKISFWVGADGQKRFETHEAHSKIENELYPNAVSNIIWVTGGIHPMMLQTEVSGGN